MDCLQEKYAQTIASNAHATIIKRKLQDKVTELDNTKKQQQRAHGSSKIKARFLTLPQYQDEFNAEETARLERKTQAADKEPKNRRKGLNERRKFVVTPHELLTLALALQLSTTGLNAQQRRSSIATHLNANTDSLPVNLRFSGLYFHTHT